MSENRKRIPLNEGMLDGVSGGAGAPIGPAVKFPVWALPEWARKYAEGSILCCRTCSAGGSIADFSYTEENGGYDFEIVFECPNGHTWDYSSWEAGS